MGNFALYSADGKKIKQNKKPTSLEDLKLCLKVRQGNGQVRTEAVQSQNQKQAKTISAVLDGKGAVKQRHSHPGPHKRGLPCPLQAGFSGERTWRWFLEARASFESVGEDRTRERVKQETDLRAGWSVGNTNAGSTIGSMGTVCVTSQDEIPGCPGDLQPGAFISNSTIPWCVRHL